MDRGLERRTSTLRVRRRRIVQRRRRDAHADPVAPTTPTVGVEPVFSGIALTSPVAMLQAPGDSTRWFVVEQGGRVRVFSNGPMRQHGDATSSIFPARVTFNGETGLARHGVSSEFPSRSARVSVLLAHERRCTGLVSRLVAVS